MVAMRESSDLILIAGGAFGPTVKLCSCFISAKVCCRRCSRCLPARTRADSWCSTGLGVISACIGVRVATGAALSRCSLVSSFWRDSREAPLVRSWWGSSPSDPEASSAGPGRLEAVVGRERLEGRTMSSVWQATSSTSAGAASGLEGSIESASLCARIRRSRHSSRACSSSWSADSCAFFSSSSASSAAAVARSIKICLAWSTIAACSRSASCSAFSTSALQAAISFSASSRARCMTWC
mmetsp:Transcript_30767/g.70977  ORF Transcript_30767/g.70977 Transcript_30767/m.70977 type:complete len:240 (-) Transcript_30767:2393-3112(-)